MLQRMLSGLDSLNIAQRGEKGSWLLSRDLDQVSLAELYDSLHLRVPAADIALPCHDDAIGQAAARAMEQLRQPMLTPLQLSVGSFLNPRKE